MSYQACNRNHGTSMSKFNTIFKSPQTLKLTRRTMKYMKFLLKKLLIVPQLILHMNIAHRAKFHPFPSYRQLTAVHKKIILAQKESPDRLKGST